MRPYRLHNFFLVTSSLLAYFLRYQIRIIADPHIHSRYGRACSQEMDVSTLAKWARIKGVNLLGTGEEKGTRTFSLAVTAPLFWVCRAGEG